MATLEKIRSKAGLLVFIVGFALLAFILGTFLTPVLLISDSLRKKSLRLMVKL